MTNVIKRIVKDGEYGTQTVKMVVRSNERGPQGEQGEPGEAATIQAGQAYAVNPDTTPAVINTGTSTNAVFDFYIPKGTKGDTGPSGKDGAIQYTAGTGIKIEDNVISATGGGGGGDGVWGQITGDIEDQTDLQNELAGKENKLTAGGGITLSYGDDSTTIEANIWPRDFFTNQLVATEGSGTQIMLTDVLPTKFSQIHLVGNMSQDGTPTPSTPVPIDVATGTQTVTISNSMGVVMSNVNVRLGAIKLASLGSIVDRIARTNGKGNWWLMQSVKSYTFTGNETWVTNAEGTNSWDFVLDGYNNINDQYIGAISEFAKGVSYNNRASGDATNTCVCYGNNATSTFTLRNTNLTTLAQVQAATTGKTIYYACSPTITYITDADLLYDLNNLASRNAQLGTTVVKITATSPSYPMQMYLSAYRFSRDSMGYAIGAATGDDVQADWTETVSNSPAYIKNKPVIPSYSDFVGTDGVTGGTAGLVPAPATTDVGKFLKADGTWDTAGGGSSVTVVQTTGTSQTDVMSQDATTKLIFPDIANNPYKMVIGEGSIDGTNKGLAINGIMNPGITGGSIAIGAPDGDYATIGQNGRADRSIAIGNTASAGRGWTSIAIGTNAYTNSGQNTGDNVAIGTNTNAGNGIATSTVALGAYAKTTRTGEVNIGTGTNGTGYNSTNYRVLGGVHDGQLAQDAATVAQVNATIDAINTALSTSIPHIGA